MPWLQSQLMHVRMEEADIASAIKVYETGGHGFRNLGDEPLAEMVRFFRKALQAEE